MRLAKKKDQVKESRMVGLGGLLRGHMAAAPAAKHLTPAASSGSAGDDQLATSKVLSAAKIVGGGDDIDEAASKLNSLSKAVDEPAVVKKTGSAIGWITQKDKDISDARSKKTEEMNRIYHEKMMEKEKAKLSAKSV